MCPKFRPAGQIFIFTFAESTPYAAGSNRKSAFTLAEVLITLGIIAVVAAMTMPALIANHQRKVLETAFKKSYSVISQGVQRMIFEEGYIPNSEEITTNLEFLALIKKYFVIAKDCSSSSGSSGTKCRKNSTDYSSNTYQFNAMFVDIYKTYNRNNTGGGTLPWYFDDGWFVLADGSFIFLDRSTSDDYLISVDTNGFKEPNMLGHDLFVFAIDHKTGKLKPFDVGEEITDDNNKYCNKTSSDPLNGLSCAVDALKNPDYYFKNLP